MSTPSDGFYQLPPGRLTLPTEPEEHFAMRRIDWQRCRMRMQQLTNPAPYLGQIAWACVGIAGSAVLAEFTWIAAYSQLPARAHEHYAWVSPAIISGGVAAVVVAVFCFIVNRKLRSGQTTTVQQVIAEMDLIYPPAQTGPAAGPQSVVPAPQTGHPRLTSRRGR